MKHEVNELGRRIGEGHPRARYSDATVEQILRASEAKVSSQTIGALLKMPSSTVRSILNGKARRQEPSVWEKRAWRLRRKQSQ
nr:MAG TPA: helix-turn-helix domain protein [Caudoviricetes sp.]